MPSSMHDCTNRNNLKYLLASNDVHFPTSQNYSKWILISVFEGRSAGEILKRESRREDRYHSRYPHAGCEAAPP